MYFYCYLCYPEYHPQARWFETGNDIVVLVEPREFDISQWLEDWEIGQELGGN
jgi:hypothetical protein